MSKLLCQPWEGGGLRGESSDSDQLTVANSRTPLDIWTALNSVICNKKTGKKLSADKQ